LDSAASGVIKRIPRQSISDRRSQDRALMNVASTPTPVVLLVQPDDDGRRMYEEFLQAKGLMTLVVSTAEEALKLARRASIVVTGILLRGPMDGIELIRRLRADAAHARTPLVVLTACAWRTEQERAERAGCDAFLPKPCLPDVLLREVRRLLPPRRLRRLRGGLAKREKSARAHERSHRKAKAG
jgi:two-component system, cell cycle response regulator DivK